MLDSYFQPFFLDVFGLFPLYLGYFPSYQIRSLNIRKLRLWGFWKYVSFFEKHWTGRSIGQNKKSNPWKNAIFELRPFGPGRIFESGKPKNELHFHIDQRTSYKIAQVKILKRVSHMKFGYFSNIQSLKKQMSVSKSN